MSKILTIALLAAARTTMKGAIISNCGAFRYRLWHYWNGVTAAPAGWIKMSERRPERGQLIVKRWKSNDSVWAGVYAATDKDSSFDEWFALPALGVGEVDRG